ncbi:MAG: hypothetical protein LC778_06030 [Acidobacteria bacterium]|nr:hypothetical protein [Acidobacteriota bacterium]
MLFHNNSRFHFVLSFTNFLLVVGFLLASLTLSCSAQTPQQVEEKALQTLRQLTKDGKLPSEAVVLQLEATFPKGKTGALARLVRARIHFEAGDFDGAAQILSSDLFRQKTNVADYARIANRASRANIEFPEGFG